ncbi:MAG: SDR family oxidoreductase [Bacteroidetes bacterium]|nr:SDR family oxidoreductase [Bacteroidota bacterium]
MNVIITGATKGMGKAIAQQFAAAGFQLLVCSRNEMDLYALVAELITEYPQASVKAKAADLSNKKEAIEFGNWCLQFGAPDILVNNAGQFVPGSIHNEADGILEDLMAVNLYSAYHLTRAVLPTMITAKTGHIFNICSIASLNAYANGGSYSITKFALLGFSKNLREELKPHGIKVTSVSPGATLSASWDGFEIDPKRIMEAADIAKMVFAASQLSPQAVVEDIVMRPQLGDL